MRNTEIALIKGITDETVSRIINGTYTGDKELINEVLFLHNYKGEYIDILFKSRVFGRMCELVVERATGKGSEEIIKFASICLMRYEELNSDIPDADKRTDIEPARVLRLFGFEPKSVVELFLDKLFEEMCLMANRRSLVKDVTHQEIRYFASLCYEASHFYRVKMGRDKTKLHGNMNKKRKPKIAEAV